MDKGKVEGFVMGSSQLVFVPGLLCNDLLWEPVINRLQRSCDFGSYHIADISQDHTIDRMAERILHDINGSFWIAGFSMGGYVAQAVIRKASERVYGLALLGSSARKDTNAQMQRRMQLIKSTKFGRFKGVTQHLLPTLIHTQRLQDGQLCDIVYAMAHATGKQVFVQQQQALMTRIAGHDVLSRVKVPVLILVGKQDLITPVKLHEEMASLIPQCSLNIIEACGHLSPLEQPDQVSEHIIKWFETEQHMKHIL